MRRNIRGLSMLEILICMAIFTIVATGVMTVNALPRRAALTLEDKMNASLALERKLDELRAQDVTSLANGVQTQSFPGLTSGILTTDISTPDAARPDWKEVYLSISWTDRRGVAQSQVVVSSLYNG